MRGGIAHFWGPRGAMGMKPPKLWRLTAPAPGAERRNNCATGRVEALMPLRKESSRLRRRRALIFAVLCAALVGAATMVPLADAGKRASVIGKTKHTPRPLCPAKPPENQPNPGTKKSCSVVGSVTGFQLKADGVHSLMKAHKTGKIVAWAVNISKPNKIERNAFGALNFFGTKKYGKEATARIGVIVPK